jgi:hypothetical protein
LTAIALQPSDLPAGWTGTAPDPDPDSAAESAAIAQCTGGHDNYADETGDSSSDDYSLDNATISSEATSFRSQADVADDIAIITSPKINDCYVKLLETEGGLPPGATIDSASFLVTPGSAGGPANVIATGAGHIEVTVSGQVVDVYVNVAFITGHSLEAEVDFENLGAAVPATVRAPLIAKVAARASGAPGANGGTGAQT